VITIMSAFEYWRDADGIVTVTMNMTGPVNAMNGEYRETMGATVQRLEQEADLRGVVLTSAKSTFFAGGDLRELLAAQPGTEEEFMVSLQQTKDQLRRLEKLPVPVVAAINGAALGGGFEIALSCNRRIVFSSPTAVVGLPEVTLGLLPGGGGIVRLVHLLGLEKALPYLLEGTRATPAEALLAGLVDELVEKGADLVPAAKAWIKANPTACEQPWDRKNPNIPGGTLHQPHIVRLTADVAAMLAEKNHGLLPAPERVLAVASQTTIVDFDTALRIESLGLTYLAMTPQAKNMISTMFFQMNEVRGGASRPARIEKSKITKLGILGAGITGQAIACSSAGAGIEVVLLDVSLEAAQKGKAGVQKRLATALAKGGSDEKKRDAILRLIKPATRASDLEGCELIVEAVYENIELKEQVTRETEQYLVPNGVFGSTTSTLPISLLARAATHPENFIGLHFLAPLHTMALVEIICGQRTNEATLAKAFDYARQIGKTAIAVNDSLGFFTSRTHSTYLDEGAHLLKDGVEPELIEHLGRQIGMPVGPLAAQDEVSQELTRKVAKTHFAMGVLYSKVDTRASTEICELLTTEFGRGGRHHGGGYYDYPDNGGQRLWPELHGLFVKADVSLPAEDVKDRLLFRQVIEAIKCLQEGVLRSVAEGNVGSILGCGAPVWTGGWLQFVNTYGLQRFVKRSSNLAARYGERFTPPELLLQKARTHQTF
jgi:3-hydroxyacyl-CoA dehydrogenase / enoyl-CoA hydratase / 3-hydroxybutyryl-CoA epimerase